MLDRRSERSKIRWTEPRDRKRARIAAEFAESVPPARFAAMVVKWFAILLPPTWFAVRTLDPAHPFPWPEMVVTIAFLSSFVYLMRLVYLWFPSSVTIDDRSIQAVHGDVNIRLTWDEVSSVSYVHDANEEVSIVVSFAGRSRLRTISRAIDPAVVLDDLTALIPPSKLQLHRREQPHDGN